MNPVHRAQHHLSVTSLIIISLMAAIMCVIAPFSVPLPLTPVPVSLGVLIVYIIAYVLPPLEACTAVTIYILIGALGLPVFSGYVGGLAKLAGPTGGYIIGYLFITLSVSFAVHRFTKKRIMHLLGMILGLALCYLFGTLWFSWQQNMSFTSSLMLCVVPFLIGDVVKIIVALIVGPELAKRLKR